MTAGLFCLFFWIGFSRFDMRREEKIENHGTPIATVRRRKNRWGAHYR